MLLRMLKKYSILLTKHQKIRIVELGFLMLIGGFLEMLSVSIMLPLINAIMKPEEVMEKWYSKIICNFFQITTSKNYLIFISIAFAVLYIVKNVYLILEYRAQYKFVYGNMFSMESKLLHNYLYKPYEFYLNAKSTEIIRIVNNDTTIVFQMLSTLIQLFTELVVSIAVVTTIFFISPIITSFVAFVLVGLVIVINFVIKPIMNKAGEINQETYTGLNKWLLQAIHGIKEVKVMQREDYFQNNFDNHGKRLANTLRTTNFLTNVPKMLIEAVSMSSIFVMIAFMVYQGKDLSAMIPVLTAIAMAAIRLLPSVNRISAAMGSVAYSEPMLDKLLENVKGIRKENEEKSNEKVSKSKIIDSQKNSALQKITGIKSKLELSDVTFKYPEGNREVLVNANMTINKGDMVGIVGPSGAGKTTTVDIILGLLKTQNGEILVDGVSIYDDLKGWLSQIGYIPQTIFLLDSSIRSNVAFGISENEISDEDVWRALDEASLSDFVRTLPEGINTEVGERGVRLSGGQRQRIGIARALYLNPEILIMDEATSALDDITEKEIMDAIRNLQGKKTMIIIAHRVSTLDSCNCIFSVNEGKIVTEKEQKGLMVESLT